VISEGMVVGGTVGTGDEMSVVAGEGRAVPAGAVGDMVGPGIVVSRGIGVVVGLVVGVGVRNGANSGTGVWIRVGDGSDVDVIIFGLLGKAGFVSTGTAGVSRGARSAIMVSAAEVRTSSWGVKTPAGGCSKAWQEYSMRLYRSITSPDRNI
jgi:hypothetical protein